MVTSVVTSETKIAVLETKVEAIREDIHDIKDSMNSTTAQLKTQLDTMYNASCQQHEALASEIKSLKKFRDRWGWTLITVLGLGGWMLLVLGWVIQNWQFVKKVLDLY